MSLIGWKDVGMSTGSINLMAFCLLSWFIAVSCAVSQCAESVYLLSNDSVNGSGVPSMICIDCGLANLF